MYINVNINGASNIKVAFVSVAELRAIERNVTNISAGIVIEGDIQVDRVIDEGDTQVARVIDEGNTQVTRVSDEGDTQVARVIVLVDEAEDSAGEALAESMNSDSWSNAPLDTDVINHVWNPVTDLIESTPIPNARSSFHWQEIAKTTSAGLTFQGFYDSVDCSLPATPIPPVGELANGYFYIVASVTGDPTGCPDMGVGDWLIWSGDLDGDAVVEGAWGLLNWSFAWSAISDVTVDGSPTANGQDLVSTTKSDSDNATQDDAIALNTAKVTGSDRVLQTEYDTEQQIQDEAIAINTDKPTFAQLYPIGSVVLRMDAINPSTIYGGTWALITGDASLNFGDGSIRDGVASGNNTPAVPLLEHSHANTATFAGDELPAHSHSKDYHTVGFDANYDTPNVNDSSHSINTTYVTGSTSSGTPAGSIDMTNANAGTAGVTLDVRGSRISINVWRRTS